jgi:hypothetical protein
MRGWVLLAMRPVRALARCVSGRRGVVMMSQRPRAVFGVCLAVAVALVAPAAAVAAPPATLTGEEFLHGGVPSPACETPGTVSYTASGTATGPYSGTFTETGTAAGTVFPNSLTSLSASFTIYSLGGAVLVKGTTIASSGTWCQDPGIGVAVTSSPAYQATIFTANGNYSDRGTSHLLLDTNSAGNATGFDEDFTSSLTQPVLISPTSKDQCKNGGWQSIGTLFKNQGDCLSFVASDGKNPPSGS